MGTFRKDIMKAVTFSFDDGVTQDIGFIELLNKYGLKATFNINSQLLGNDDWLIRENQRVSHYKISKRHFADIYKDHEVAAHTLTHPPLTMQTDEEVIRQVEQDRLWLSDAVGYEVVGFAYPGGGTNYNSRVADLIRNNTGIKYCRTIQYADNFDDQEDLYVYKPTLHHLNFSALTELGQKFIEMKPDKPQVFCIWGHSFELDYQSSHRQNLEEFFKLISGKDDIFYGTCREVLLH